MHMTKFLRSVLLFIFLISFRKFSTQHLPLNNDTYKFIHQFIVNINGQLKKKKQK